MNKPLAQLLTLCPGRLSVEFNQHKLFNETAQQVIERTPKVFGKHIDRMCDTDTIIRVEAVPKDIPMPMVEVYHYDFDLALKETLKQIKKWKPEK